MLKQYGGRARVRCRLSLVGLDCHSLTRVGTLSALPCLCAGHYSLPKSNQESYRLNNSLSADGDIMAVGSMLLGGWVDKRGAN